MLADALQAALWWAGLSKCPFKEVRRLLCHDAQEQRAHMEGTYVLQVCAYVRQHNVGNNVTWRDVLILARPTAPILSYYLILPYLILSYLSLLTDNFYPTDCLNSAPPSAVYMRLRDCWTRVTALVPSWAPCYCCNRACLFETSYKRKERKIFMWPRTSHPSILQNIHFDRQSNRRK